MSLFTKLTSSVLNTFQHLQSPTAHDPSGLPPYRYTALPSSRSIRLLELHAGLPEEIIRSTLHVIDIDSDPIYNALSYTWGDPRPPLLQSIAPQQWRRQLPIICNGGITHVTANLHHALLKLRILIGESDGPLPGSRIWIDALCIYSHRTTMKYLRKLRFPPQFFEGFHSSALGILS